MVTAEVEGIDLCAGPGGWDVACRQLGWHVLGIEWDDAACATRLAAGLPTLRGDIAALNPIDVVAQLTTGRCTILIASPPCTTFSMAGKGIGRTVLPQLAKALHEVAAGERHSSIEHIRAVLVEQLVATMEQQREERARLIEERVATLSLDDEERAELLAEASEVRSTPVAHEDAVTTTLVLEPMRWLRDLEPELLAMEQVPPVLPLWEVFVRILRDDLGWRSAWTGVLNAADFGVPQTRKRAVLIASRHGVVTAPPATHCKGGADPDLFGDGLDPWVSMAQALGWGMTAKPSVTVQAAGGAGGGPRPLDGGAHAREAVQRERDEGRWEEPPVVNTRGDLSSDGGNEFSSEQPSWALTSSARSWTLHTNRGTEYADGERQKVESDRPAPTVTSKTGEQWRLRAGNQDRATERGLDEPAPTIAFGHASASMEWVPLREADGLTVEEVAALCDIDPDHLRHIVGENPHVVRTNHTTSKGYEEGGPRVPYERPVSEPAPAVGTRADLWELGLPMTLRTGHNSMKHSRDPQDMVPFERSVNEPAPTVDAKVGTAWKVAPEGGHIDPPMRWKDRPGPDPGGEDGWVYDRPSTTVAGSNPGIVSPLGGGKDVSMSERGYLPFDRSWADDRPATTIAADSRVWPPGHKVNADDIERLGAEEAASRYGDRAGTEAIRITVQQAAILQSFPPDHPWQGSQTKQFEQVGNAVPCLLAWHVLTAVSKGLVAA